MPIQPKSPLNGNEEQWSLKVVASFAIKKIIYLSLLGAVQAYIVVIAIIIVTSLLSLSDYSHLSILQWLLIAMLLWFVSFVLAWFVYLPPLIKIIVHMKASKRRRDAERETF